MNAFHWPVYSHMATSFFFFELLCVSFYLHTIKFTLFGVHIYNTWLHLAVGEAKK